jgi:hypothetical protein
MVAESGVILMIVCYSLGLATGVCIAWFLFRTAGSFPRGK